MRIALNPGLRDGRFAVIRAITGHDELALDPSAPWPGTTLAGRVLVAVPGTSVAPATLPRLSIADRDRILAAVYQSCYGDRIEAVTTCPQCGERFTCSFSLTALVAQRSGPSCDAAAGPDADGFFVLADGMRVRPPTVGDLEAVGTLDAEQAEAALVARCDGSAKAVSSDRLQEAIELLAPLLDLDLDAACPECGSTAQVRFSIEAFLLRAIANERRFLTSELHRLASAYGWSLNEVLSLSRDDRRTLVRHVEADRARARR